MSKAAEKTALISKEMINPVHPRGGRAGNRGGGGKKNVGKKRREGSAWGEVCLVH